MSSILFIIPSLNFGGAEMLLLEQLHYLQTKGCKTCLIILSVKNAPELLEQLNLPSDQLLILRSNESVLNFKAIAYAIKNQRKLIHFARSHYIKNIVAHLPLSHFWGRLLKLQYPTAQLIVYHHSMQYQASPLDTQLKKVFNYIQKQLAKSTDDISVCISEAVMQNIRENFILKNPYILFNAVPDKSATLKDRVYNFKSTRANAIRLILPGRLHPAKGHMFFLPIFKSLIKEKLMPLHLTIAGGGPLHKSIESFVKENQLQNNVTVTGYISNELMLNYMAEADYVIIPSISEGLGLVAIEALMLGKTIIASDAGGLKEVLSHKKNAYLFQAGVNKSCLNLSTIVLSEYPSSLLSPPALRRDYENRFSFAAYIEKFESLLKK